MSNRLIGILTHGHLDEVAALVDANELTNVELRSVILNLITHIERIERRIAATIPANG